LGIKRENYPRSSLSGRGEGVPYGVTKEKGEKRERGESFREEKEKSGAALRGG